MNQIQPPDHTAVRVALWRALHTEVDSSPHILKDEVGLRLIEPDVDWRKRPDMHPEGTAGYRASIVGRARFIEDILQEKLEEGLSQYVILGAGLDTFAERRADLADRVTVFEIDKPQTQEWKKERLIETGLGIAKNLKFVPVDFEANESWLEKLKTNGFGVTKPALIVSTGVSMYLTKEANRATLKEAASFSSGSVFVMTFLLPLELLNPEERPQHEMVYEKARAAGTPFLSFYKPSELLAVAKEAGFSSAQHISKDDIIRRYFLGRSDGLRPSSGEEILVAKN